MRRHVDARVAPERVRRRQRLVAEHVQGGMGELAAVERVEQVGLDQMRAARDVDQPGAPRAAAPSARRRGCRGSRPSAAAGRPGCRSRPGRRPAPARRRSRRHPPSAFARPAPAAHREAVTAQHPGGVLPELAQAQDADARRLGRRRQPRTASAAARCCAGVDVQRRDGTSAPAPARTRSSAGSATGRSAGTSGRSGRVGSASMASTPAPSDSTALQVGQGAQQAGRHAPDQGRLDLGRIAGVGPGAEVEVGQPAQQGAAPSLGILVRAVEQKRHAVGPRARTCRGLVARLSHRCKAAHTAS